MTNKVPKQPTIPPMPKKRMTNGERLRQMTDEELAKWLYIHFNCLRCPYFGEAHNTTQCKDKLLKWLKQESEEEL